jgi:hypothetical protein
VKEISGNIAHTVDFIQGAITIILALALGEALKLFVTPHGDSPMQWDRLPGLLAFLFTFFPFFQGMSQYLYLTYLNPATAPPFYPGYLMFDGAMNVLEAACFFVMSNALAPKHWRHFYGAVLALMLIDIGWTALTMRRGIHVGAWFYIDIVIVVVVAAMFLYERNKPLSMRPVYVGLALLMTSTAVSYWLERDVYFP